MIDKSPPKLPVIHARRLRDPSRLFEIEQLDLEFSNGARRTYERMKTRGLGAVIIVPMKDDKTVLLVREYAAGLHKYEIGLRDSSSPTKRAGRRAKGDEGGNRFRRH
jgi:ADP-ribose diphosphatase